MSTDKAVLAAASAVGAGGRLVRLPVPASDDGDAGMRFIVAYESTLIPNMAAYEPYSQLLHLPPTDLASLSRDAKRYYALQRSLVNSLVKVYSSPCVSVTRVALPEGSGVDVAKHNEHALAGFDRTRLLCLTDPNGSEIQPVVEQLLNPLAPAPDGSFSIDRCFYEFPPPPLPTMPQISLPPNASKGKGKPVATSSISAIPMSSEREDWWQPFEPRDVAYVYVPHAFGRKLGDDVASAPTVTIDGRPCLRAAIVATFWWTHDDDDDNDGNKGGGKSDEGFQLDLSPALPTMVADSVTAVGGGTDPDVSFALIGLAAHGGSSGDEEEEEHVSLTLSGSSSDGKQHAKGGKGKGGSGDSSEKQLSAAVAALKALLQCVNLDDRSSSSSKWQ